MYIYEKLSSFIVWLTCIQSVKVREPFIYKHVRSTYQVNRENLHPLAGNFSSIPEKKREKARKRSTLMMRPNETISCANLWRIMPPIEFYQIKYHYKPGLLC